jgi:hypothetical protein
MPLTAWPLPKIFSGFVPTINRNRQNICCLEEVREITDFTDNIDTVGENPSTVTKSLDTHPYKKKKNIEVKF